MTRKGRYVIVDITFDLCKASGNELAQSSTIFRYSVPIYVWIFENGLKELQP